MQRCTSKLSCYHYLNHIIYSLGEGNGTSLQYSCLENPMDGGAWCRQQSMGLQRVGQDWATSLSLFTFVHWRRKWQPTPVVLPGESQVWGSLVGCRLWGCRVGHDWSDLAVAAVATTYTLSHIQLFFFLFFSFIFISWRLITLQYCSSFCHTLTWISHGFTCVPHPEPPSHLPLYPFPLGLPSAPALSTCLLRPKRGWRSIHLWISSNEVDETGAHYTEWSKPER